MSEENNNLNYSSESEDTQYIGDTSTNDSASASVNEEDSVPLTRAEKRAREAKQAQKNNGKKSSAAFTSPRAVSPETTSGAILSQSSVNNPTEASETQVTEKEVVTRSSAKKKANSKKIPLPGILFIIFLVLAILVWGIYFFTNGNNSSTAPKKSTAPHSSTPTASQSQYSANLPLLKIYSSAPTVAPQSENINVDSKNRELSSSLSNNKIIFASSVSLTANGQKCSVVQPTDFCMAGTTKSGNSKFDVFYLRDAAHSRLFENPKNFVASNIMGAKASATLNINMGSRSANSLVVVTQNSSGWLFVPQDANSQISQMTSTTSVK